MAWARHGRGMASVNQTRPHCVNQMGKTHSKPLAARHGRGTIWARHAMCESALRSPPSVSMNDRRILRPSQKITTSLPGSKLLHVSSHVFFLVRYIGRKKQCKAFKGDSLHPITSTCVYAAAHFSSGGPQHLPGHLIQYNPLLTYCTLR